MAAFSALALTAMAAKSVVDAYGAHNAGNAQSAQDDLAASTLRQNAQIADAQSADAIARGSLASRQIETQGRQVEGDQRTTAAANGLDTTTGTPAALIGETGFQSSLDALMAKTNAAREAWGYQVGAAQDRTQAAMYQTAGRQARRQGNLNAGLTLLTGALNMKGSGLFGGTTPNGFAGNANLATNLTIGGTG